MSHRPQGEEEGDHVTNTGTSPKTVDAVMTDRDILARKRLALDANPVGVQADHQL